MNSYSLHTAAYSEKYRRNQDDIDVRIEKRYYAQSNEQHSKIPEMTSAIRGKVETLDSQMNKLIWGGKANIQKKPEEQPKTASPSDEYDEDNDEYDEYDDYDEDSSSSSSSSDEEDGSSDSSSEGGDEKKPKKKKRKNGRKQKKASKSDKKSKREARRRKREEAAAASKKLMAQSMAAGVTIGAAVAVATFLVSGRRK